MPSTAHTNSRTASEMATIRTQRRASHWLSKRIIHRRRKRSSLWRVCSSSTPSSPCRHSRPYKSACTPCVCTACAPRLRTRRARRPTNHGSRSILIASSNVGTPAARNARTSCATGRPGSCSSTTSASTPSARNAGSSASKWFSAPAIPVTFATCKTRISCPEPPILFCAALLRMRRPAPRRAA